MLASLVSLIVLALRAAELAVVGAVVASLLDVDRSNPIVRALRAVADPLLRLAKPIARRIPGPFDWSPLIVLLTLDFVRTALLRAIS
jgi:YggT family protein